MKALRWLVVTPLIFAACRGSQATRTPTVDSDSTEAESRARAEDAAVSAFAAHFGADTSHDALNGRFSIDLVSDSAKPLLLRSVRFEDIQLGSQGRPEALFVDGDLYLPGPLAVLRLNITDSLLTSIRIDTALTSGEYVNIVFYPRRVRAGVLKLATEDEGEGDERVSTPVLIADRVRLIDGELLGYAAATSARRLEGILQRYQSGPQR